MKQLPNVTILTQYFYPSTGATAQLISDLADGLSEHGHRVTVITNTPGGTTSGYTTIRLSDAKSESEITVLNKLSQGFKFFFGALLWLVVNQDANSRILIASNPPFAVLIGWSLKKLKGVSYTFILQDLFPRSAVLSGVLPPRGPFTYLWRRLMYKGCSSADSTVVLSRNMYNRAKREYFGLDNLVTIHNWAVESGLPLEKASNPLAIEWGIQDKFTVQYSGNFGRLHDLLTLLEAARLLKTADVQFVFIGDGSKRDIIETYIKSNELYHTCRLLPYVPRSLLSHSLAACDISAVCLTPGSEDTVAPSKVCGILSSSKPILLISSRNSRFATTVKKYDAGIAVECGDAEGLASMILDLKKDPKRLQRMQANAFELYNKIFDKKRSVQQYSSLLSVGISHPP